MCSPNSHSDNLFYFFFPLFPLVSIFGNSSIPLSNLLFFFLHVSVFTDHIYTNGIKGSFVPVVNMCKAVFQHVDVIVALLSATKTFSRSEKRGDRNKSFLLSAASFNILRFGMVSNNPAVALWCVRTLTQIVSHFEKMSDAAHLHQYAWQWFIKGSATDRTAGTKSTTGLDTLMRSLAKHQDLKFPLITLMDAVSNKNLAALFCNHLRAVCPTPLEYLNFVTDMLQPLLEERQTMRNALMEEGIVKYWSDIVKTHADKGVNKEVRQAAMHLMIELWSQLPEGIEGIPDLPNYLLGLLKKGARDSNLSVQITSLTGLFMLLDYFAGTNVSYAPYVYKTLIFSLIENHSNEVVRDYIMINLGTALETMDQVPVGVMVEPVVKQISLKGYSNQDFPTFVTLAKHPRLSVRHGLMLMDLLGKIALNDPIYGRVATLPLLIVLNRFPSEAPVSEYVERYAKVALSMLMHVETKDLMARRKKLDPTDQKVKNEAENIIIRRTLVLELLGKIIHLGHGSYARKILPLLRALDRQYTQMVGDAMPQDEDSASGPKDLGASTKSENLGSRRHPGIVSLIRFCGEILQSLKGGGNGGDGSGGGGRNNGEGKDGGGNRRRRGGNRTGSRGGSGSRGSKRKGGDSKSAFNDDNIAAAPEPDFESTLMQKEPNSELSSRGGGSRGSKASKSGSREKPRSAGNDTMNIGGYEGFEAFSMAGVVADDPHPFGSESDGEDHEFNEHQHDSDDEETKALLNKHNLMPGDRMRIERERKKRRAERDRKAKLLQKPQTPEIVHKEMDAAALEKIHAEIHAHSEDENPFADEDEKKRQRARKARERKAKKKKQYRAVGEDSLDQEQLKKAAARRKKRDKRNASKPWEQSAPKKKKDEDDDADDEDDDDHIIDMTAHSARMISGRKAFKNKKVQRDIDRAAAQRRQMALRKTYDDERRRLRSRELRSYIRNRYHKRIMKKLEKKAAKALKERPFDQTHLPSGARYLEHTITPEEVMEKHNSDFQALMDYQCEAVEMFRRWHKPMRWLFHMYAHSDNSTEVQETSFQDQKESAVTLGPKEWQILCRDFDIIPELGDMAKAGKCFVRGNVSLKTAGDNNQCTFEEFNSILRRLVEYLPLFNELPSYNARVAAVMGYMRRKACDYDKTEGRGDLKNRRMGDLRVWQSDYVDMIKYEYEIPKHLGYSLSLIHVLEIIDETIMVKVFNKHFLTFAPNAWNDSQWKPPEEKWVPDVTEVELTPAMERLYVPSNTHARDFNEVPLQTGLEDKSFSSTSLRFPRDIEREKLLAVYEEKGIVIHRPRKPLSFGEKCVRNFALKSVAAARTAIEVLGDLADDVVSGVAREKLESKNNGTFDIEEPLNLSLYTFVPDLTDPLEVVFMARRKNFADIGPTRVPAPALEPPILKAKETEKRTDRLAREKALDEIKQKKLSAYKKKRYDMQQRQKKLHKEQKAKKKDEEDAKKKETEELLKKKKDRKNAALAAKRQSDKEKINQWRRQQEMEKKEEERKTKLSKRRRMQKNEEVVDRLNAKYHFMEQNAEQNTAKRQEDRALHAQQKKERLIQERQERHQKLVENVSHVDVNVVLCCIVFLCLN